jgi:MFS transporter, DHA1 family, multidrug resistance protein
MARLARAARSIDCDKDDRVIRPTAPRPLSHRFLIVFCGLLLASNAFSTDVLLPAIYSIERAYGVRLEQVQMSMPLFIFSSAFGQLIYGPASDRFGRKPVLLVGLGVYTAAGVLALLAPNMEMLLVARSVQGFGSAAGIVVGRAILRDTHAGAALAQVMALAMMMIALGPIFAPLVGTSLVAVGGWRAAFAAMVAFGAIMTVVALLKLEETNRSFQSDALDGKSWSRAVQRVFGHSQSRFFLSFAALLAFTIMSFVAHAPRFFNQAFGWDGFTFAGAFALMGAGIIVGQFINTRAITRWGVVATTKLALAVQAFACVAIAAFFAAGALSGVGFVMLMFLFNCGFLSVMANAASLTLDPHPDIAGLASSLYGFVTQAVPGALAMATLGLIGGDIGIWACLVSAITCGLLGAIMLFHPGVRRLSALN